MWMFMTILIVVCLIITLGLLTVFVVTFVTGSTGSTGTTGTTGHATGFTAFTGPVAETNNEMNLRIPKAELDSIHVIHDVKWNPESGTLEASYSSSLKNVQFSVVHQESRSGWPLWTSPQIRVPKPFKAQIHDRSLPLFQNPSTNSVSPENAFILRLENPETKQVLAIREFF